MANLKHPGIVREDLFGGVGSVRVMSPLVGDSGPFTAVLACELAPSGSVGPHVQEEFPELVLGCAGSGIATVDGVQYALDPGDAVYLPLGSVLALENRSSQLPLVYFIVKARS
jgi:quercetin dioxygenase-like cupin family protein